MRLKNNKESNLIVEVHGKILHWPVGEIIEVDESLGHELLAEGYEEAEGDI